MFAESVHFGMWKIHIYLFVYFCDEWLSSGAFYTYKHYGFLAFIGVILIDRFFVELYLSIKGCNISIYFWVPFHHLQKSSAIIEFFIVRFHLSTTEHFSSFLVEYISIFLWTSLLLESDFNTYRWRWPHIFVSKFGTISVFLCFFVSF